jgi:subtilisin family serine protease
VLQEVRDVLGEQEIARVVVSLVDPVSPDAPDGARLREVANVQSRLLGELRDSRSTEGRPADFRLLHRYEYIPALLAEVTAEGAAVLGDSALVSVVQPDRANRPLLAEHVPAVKGDLVHAQYGLTGEGVNVAVFDTGIDTDHPDLEDDIVAQKCYSVNGGCRPNNATEGPSAEDEDGHGTSVSGIITSKGTVSSVGIAPDAGIVAVRVFDDSASAQTSDMLKGFDWLIRNRRTFNVKLVNMSLGGGKYTGNCDREDQARADAIAQLNARGVTVFAASGNDGEQNALAAPACISNVVAVGATYDAELGRQPAKGTFGNGCFDETTSAETIACFSNVSRALALVAPGVWTESTAPGGGKAISAGTSNASPMAAGVAALVLQADDSLRPSELERLLKNTGDSVRHPKVSLSFPLVNALAAIQQVVPATPSPTSTEAPSETPTPTATSTPPASATPTTTSSAVATADPTGTDTPQATAVTPSPEATSTETDQAVDTWRLYLPKLDCQ